MRREPTEPEKRLWRALSGSKLGGFKFRRQAVIGDYIVDFLCPSVGLVVEVDGDTHDAGQDALRDRILHNLGLHVVRITNADVMQNADGVLALILETLQSLAPRSNWRLPHPNPSPEGEGLTGAAARLVAVSDTPRLDAELLLAHALGITREALLLDPPVTIPDGFERLVQRRLAHEPIAYILGTRDFWTVSLAVRPGVLIPRPDSETLIEAAVDHFAGTPGPRTILDLGTGSGALLIAALAQWPGATGIGVDRSADAIAVARDNLDRLGLADRARIVAGGWDGAGGAHDLILCNPPYIATTDPLPRDVADHEPAEALFAGPEGLDDYRRIAPLLAPQLAPGGVACVEIGAAQAAAVSRLFQDHDLSVRTRKDLGGRDRCLVLARP